MAGAKVSYRIISCPNCKQKIERRNLIDYRVGSPFRTCPSCGAEYIDRDYHELAIEPYKDPKPIKVYLLMALAFAVMLPLIAYYIAPDEWQVFAVILVPLTVLPCLLIAMVKYLRRITGAEKRELQRELDASTSRFRDPVYCYKMLRAGYKIPDSVLNALRTSIVDQQGE